MSKNKVLLFIIVLIVFLIVNSNGYYNRNIRVDDVFLDTIAQSIINLEESRISNDPYLYDDVESMWHILNQGDMGSNSSAEIDIAFAVQAMSEYLYMYNDEISSGVPKSESEIMKNYFEALEEVCILLEPYRERNDAIESLWTKNIFN